MEFSRTKNAKRNILTGLLSKIISLFLPFLVRTVILWKLSSEYLGLSELFSSILQVLNMSELGISSCIIFSLYKPLAEDDTDQVCALMAFYRRVYHIIGLVILVVGFFLLPFLQKFVKDDITVDINIYVLYLLFLGNTVISYFAFAYKSVLLTASQNQSVISNIESILSIVKCILQIIVLFLFSDFYLYIVCNIVYTIFYNIVIAKVTTKRFPEYICKGVISGEKKKEMFKQIGGLAIGKLNLTSRNSFDNIVLSMFCGLVPVAIYSNYFYIYSAVGGFISIIVMSISAGIGNTVITKTKEELYKDFEKFNFMMNWILGFCCVCLFCLYQPFMKIWVGEELIASTLTMSLICVYFFIGNCGQIRSMYSGAMGIWWEFKIPSIIEMFLNLLLNFVLGYFWGMNGIILATIITITICSLIWNSKISFKKCFGKSSINFLLTMLSIFLIIAIVGCFTYYVCDFVRFTGVFELALKLIICVFFSNLLFLVIFSLKKEYRKYMKEIFRTYLKIK